MLLVNGLSFGLAGFVNCVRNLVKEHSRWIGLVQEKLVVKVHRDTLLLLARLARHFLGEPRI